MTSFVIQEVNLNYLESAEIFGLASLTYCSRSIPVREDLPVEVASECDSFEGSIEIKKDICQGLLPLFFYLFVSFSLDELISLTVLSSNKQKCLIRESCFVKDFKWTDLYVK